MIHLRYASDGSFSPEERPEPHLTEPCDQRHEFCEGSTLHIRGRCVTGCPQFQDGSWMARPFCVQRGNAHPGLPRGAGQAGAVEQWLEVMLRR